ncbi:MAG: S41 family peptidase, partial [Verrucomicrobiota bacterium]|nr:S41 family peptidase [Verrucomicrobiota bacterium]
FSAKIKGVEGVFSVEFPDKLSSPALVLSKSISMPKWLSKDSRIVYTSGGVPGSLAKGKAETYSFKVLTERVSEEHQRVGFRQAWRAMRDGFYDESLNNRDWNLIREKYEGMASAAVDKYSFSRAISLMLGELNASHLGFRSSSSNSYRPKGWQDQTAHLGVIFDVNHEGSGLKIKKVLTDGPASEEKAQMREGEIIMEINGVEVSLKMDLTEVLNGRLDRDLTLKVQGLGDEQKQREVIMRPSSYSKARSLVESNKINDTRKRVDELSGGRLGYLYVARMMWSEFQKFEREIYAEGDGKEGLVIDVRNNGGGFTADHLLTVLVPPVHASTVARGGGNGYPGDRRVYATWTKPIVVLCNERSFSNAEIFSHAIKNLKRGKLVGVPTAGGVISTGSRSIMDLGTIRMPGRGWFLPDGQDMELNGAVPDHLIWPLPGELPSGNDKQLEKAVQVLLVDVEKANKESNEKLIRASQRKAIDVETGQ